MTPGAGRTASRTNAGSSLAKRVASRGFFALRLARAFSTLAHVVFCVRNAPKTISARGSVQGAAWKEASVGHHSRAP